MRLECEDGRSFDNPTQQVIEQVVGKLGQPGTNFVILGRDDDCFIQSGADEEGRCDLEYRDGSDQKHFRCTKDALSVQEVIAAFKDYAAGNETWKTRFQWEALFPEASDEPDQPADAKPKKSGCASVLLVVLACAAVILLWLA